MRLFHKSKNMVRIKPNQVFLHGVERFEPGKVYKVPIALARYFERVGWLESSDVATLPDVTTLEINDVQVDIRTEVR